ncbi:MAG: hypothetical protein ABI599_00385 [Flavobacteriales bacterium]
MQRTFLAALALCLALQTWACDLCGIYLNVLPHDRTHQFSLFYRMRSLSGNFTTVGSAKHGDDLPAESETAIAELFQTVELRADLRVRQRWSVLVSVPFVNTYQRVNGLRMVDLYSMGDPLLIARYQVLNTKGGPDVQRAVHRLMIGGGVKLPLGKDDLTYRGYDVGHDLQPGTGTWDILATVEYALRMGRNGVAFSNVLRSNGVSSNGYRFGDGLSSTLEVFRTWTCGKAQVAPSVGAYGEFAKRDEQDGSMINSTGGNTLFSHVGARLWWRSWMLTGVWQHALINDIGSAMVPNHDRMVVGLTYMLNKNNKQQ